MFSEKLKQYRESCGLTQEQFAKETGISRGIISMIEADKRPPSKKVLSLLSEHSGKSIDWWYGKDEKQYGELNALSTLLDYMIEKEMIDKKGNMDLKSKDFIWKLINAEIKNKLDKKSNNIF